MNPKENAAPGFNGNGESRNAQHDDSDRPLHLPVCACGKKATRAMVFPFSGDSAAVVIAVCPEHLPPDQATCVRMLRTVLHVAVIELGGAW